ncbi:helix-turn-helix domain-containing protein [Streptomyces sp. NBC_00056]|uniref:helix-turn-helix domain-containing protein n=1 Tax=Streptomyces sp. NBC_00056 TaxID=2975633 RepID=UPI00386B51AF
MLTGRRYRLVVTAGQAAQCQEFADICRSVWNTGLEQGGRIGVGRVDELRSAGR